jgi:hypothetical protein
MALPKSTPNCGHAADGIFGREKEVAELHSRLAQRTSFVLHGPSGSGKTFLLGHVIPAFSKVLYCADSSNPQGVFREIAAELLRDKNPRAARALGRSGNYIRQKSTIALRGIAMDVLHEAHYSVVLDHLRCPSAALASDIRDLMHWGNTCVIAVARSSHMEELGYIAPYFVLQSEQMELKNLDRKEAFTFAEYVANEMALVASNRQEFLSSAADLGDGAPGAIVTMIKMAFLPRYRCGDHIKVPPLYIDSRLAWHAANAY